ncbi:MAG: Ig-like domain-containing protein [Nitrospirota bacterium]
MGQIINKEIAVFGLKDAASVSFDFEYNPQFLQFIGATEGDFFNQGTATTSFTTFLQNQLGKVTVNVSRPTNISGSGGLMTLAFRGVAAGTSTLLFLDPKQFKNQDNVVVEIDDFEDSAVSVTGSAPDTTPPIVSSTSPANNETGVAIHSAISAIFSEPMPSAEPSVFLTNPRRLLL